MSTDTSAHDLPEAVRVAAEAIRDGLRDQEARMIDSFGTSLGPGDPRPDRQNLLTVLRHLGIPDDPSAPAGHTVCGTEITLWGATTRCVREPHEDLPHRNRYGTEWKPSV